MKSIKNMISWQNLFGVYDRALSVREEKVSLISSNLTNQETPGYKARDISFKEAMQSTVQSLDSDMAPTKTSSIDFSETDGSTDYLIKFRRSVSPSADGNTVNPHYEKMAFMDNIIRYNSTLAFIQAKKTMLMQVIKGD